MPSFYIGPPARRHGGGRIPGAVPTSSRSRLPRPHHRGRFQRWRSPLQPAFMNCGPVSALGGARVDSMTLSVARPPATRSPATASTAVARRQPGDDHHAADLSARRRSSASRTAASTSRMRLAARGSCLVYSSSKGLEYLIEQGGKVERAVSSCRPREAADPRRRDRARPATRRARRLLHRVRAARCRGRHDGGGSIARRFPRSARQRPALRRRRTPDGGRRDASPPLQPRDLRDGLLLPRPRLPGWHADMACGNAGSPCQDCTLFDQHCNVAMRTCN